MGKNPLKDRLSAFLIVAPLVSAETSTGRCPFDSFSAIPSAPSCVDHAARLASQGSVADPPAGTAHAKHQAQAARLQ